MGDDRERSGIVETELALIIVLLLVAGVMTLIQMNGSEDEDSNESNQNSQSSQSNDKNKGNNDNKGNKENKENKGVFGW